MCELMRKPLSSRRIARAGRAPWRIPRFLLMWLIIFVSSFSFFSSFSILTSLINFTFFRAIFAVWWLCARGPGGACPIHRT